MTTNNTWDDENDIEVLKAYNDKNDADVLKAYNDCNILTHDNNSTYITYNSYNNTPSISVNEFIGLGPKLDLLIKILTDILDDETKAYILLKYSEELEKNNISF